jgi:hypothetical protein
MVSLYVQFDSLPFFAAAQLALNWLENAKIN